MSFPKPKVLSSEYFNKFTLKWEHLSNNVLIKQINGKIFKYTFIFAYNISEIGRFHNKKDSGKQYVVYELTYIGAELVLHTFCGDFFYIINI